MSVERSDVIDFVACDPKTGDALLVMVEFRDWNASPIATQQLDAKLAGLDRLNAERGTGNAEQIHATVPSR